MLRSTIKEATYFEIDVRKGERVTRQSSYLPNFVASFTNCTVENCGYGNLKNLKLFSELNLGQRCPKKVVPQKSALYIFLAKLGKRTEFQFFTVL